MKILRFNGLKSRRSFEDINSMRVLSEQFLCGRRKAGLQVKESLQGTRADNNAASQSPSPAGFI